jgi:hypothetical protein
MHRAVSSVLALVGAIAVALVLVGGGGVLGSCTGHSESGSGADEPPRSRPAAAPAPPDLSLATLASVPSSPTELAADAPPACPAGMVLVDGDYCTAVRESCERWEDPPGTPLARCAKFAPTECVGHRVHERFCVDRDEYVRPGENLPLGDASWNDASAICLAEHKRLCKETEWELACEGEQMLPYTTGYERDPLACNYDRSDLVDPNTGKLRDQRRPAEQLERCVSPFGVRNMNGNLDEWVVRNRSAGDRRSALKGGWWMAARERCRPATTAHGETFHELQTGVRCCADAPNP